MKLSLFAKIVVTVLLCVLPQATVQARDKDENLTSKLKRVLVVMSYHEEYPWHVETREGIESVIDDVTITYFYMDTKRNLAGGASKAQEAFELYQRLKPDAVIAAEDNAQSMFVIPYLKDKVTTPVIFCGVNDDAGKYDYPAKNVTGILEKKHYRESINLLRLLAPQVKRIAVLYRETPSNLTNLAQLEKEQAGYKAEIAAKVKIDHVGGLEASLLALKDKVDALLVLNLSGVPDKNGEQQSSADMTALINRLWNKPTFGASTWEVKEGILCAVAKLGQEQGTVAAEMVKQAIAGKPVSSIPLAQNLNGRRVINVSTAKRIGITLTPIALIGAELVK